MGLLTAGFTLDTATMLQNNGSVLELWVANRDDIDTDTPPTISGWEISAFPLQAGKTWYQIKPEDYTIDASFDYLAKGKMTSTKTKLTIGIPTFSADNLQIAQTLMKASGLIVAVKYANGSKVLMGWDSKVLGMGCLYAVASKGDGGIHPEDSQSQTLSFEGDQIDVPYTFSFTPA